MHFRKIKRQQSEVYINEPLETDSEGNTLTIADILASNVNIEEETELRINSQKLYRYIDEELDEREKEIRGKITPHFLYRNKRLPVLLFRRQASLCPPFHAE